METSCSTIIAATPERVWDLTVDVEQWPEITPTVTDIERLDDGQLRTGSRARVTQPGLGTRIWTVRTLDHQRRFIWDTRLGNLTMTARHELTPTGRHCQNTLVLDVSGFGSSIFARLFRRAVARTLATENAGFKHALETDEARA